MSDNESRESPPAAPTRGRNVVRLPEPKSPEAEKPGTTSRLLEAKKRAQRRRDQ